MDNWFFILYKRIVWWINSDLYIAIHNILWENVLFRPIKYNIVNIPWTVVPGSQVGVIMREDCALARLSCHVRWPISLGLLALIGSMSPWVLPECTLGTVRYTETYPGNYLICRTVPCLLSTVPWLSLFRPLLMSQYLKYTCRPTDRQASYLYKVGLEYETVKPRRNFNLYTLMRAILLQILRWSGMRVSKLGTVWSRLGTVRHIR